MRDVRDEPKQDDRSEAQAAAPVDGDASVQIRQAVPADAEPLAHVFLRAYGDSYDHEWA